MARLSVAFTVVVRHSKPGLRVLASVSTMDGTSV